MSTPYSRAYWCNRIRLSEGAAVWHGILFTQKTLLLLVFIYLIDRLNLESFGVVVRLWRDALPRAAQGACAEVRSRAVPGGS
jgi:hypothetical protein